MKEIELLKKILPSLHQADSVEVGPGDDCAVLDLGADHLLLAAVDQVVANVHYDLDATAPQLIAAKLLKRNLSDIAAMGGSASWALLALASTHNNDSWYTDFYAGLESEALRWDVSICGGDLTGLRQTVPGDVASLTILGTVPGRFPALRSNALSGELLYATGCFGNSYSSGHHLNFSPRLREGKFLAETFTRTMIDVSDGLLLDAGRLAIASRVGVEMWPEAVPRRTGAALEQVMGDGEDYELLFTVAPDAAARLEKSWPFSEVLLTRIGRIIVGPPGVVVNRQGQPLAEIYPAGFNHVVK